MRESPDRLPQLASPGLVRLWTQVSENRAQRFPGGSPGCREPERGKPLLDVHLEHIGLSQIPQVPRPDADEAWLRFAQYEPVGSSKRRPPAALDAPMGRQSADLIALIVVDEGEDVDELPEVLHRDLAPGVSNEQDSVMVGMRRE